MVRSGWITPVHVLALSMTALGTVVLFFFHDTALTLARQLAGIS